MAWHFIPDGEGPQQWVFSAVNELGWDPGNNGKGFMRSDTGDIKTWNIPGDWSHEDAGSPHHLEMDMWDNDFPIWIHPDGGIEAAPYLVGWGEESAHLWSNQQEYLQRFVRADPRLHITPVKSEWHFGSELPDPTQFAMRGGWYPWQKGKFGKGAVDTETGQVVTWQLYDYQNPTHFSGLQHYGMGAQDAGGTKQYIQIQPDGTFAFWHNWGEDHDVIDTARYYIQTALPELHEHQKTVDSLWGTQEWKMGRKFDQQREAYVRRLVAGGREWQPGQNGKAITLRDGSFRIWGTNRFQMPHHLPYMMQNNLGHNDVLEYWGIEPDGRVLNFGGSMDNQQRLADQIGGYISERPQPQVGRARRASLMDDLWANGGILQGETPWEPGSSGKAILGPDGLVTWKVDQIGSPLDKHPHHYDVVHELYGGKVGVTMAEIEIYPDGECVLYCDPNDREVLEKKLTELDPRLHAQPKQIWQM